MGKNKIQILIILITIIFFLFSTSSCIKSREQPGRDIIEKVEKEDKEVLENKEQDLEEEIPVETEEIKEKEVEEVTEYSYVSKSGKIYSDEVWSGEIYITGDVWIAPDVTITILPGTK